MSRYDAKTLELQFKLAAALRIRKAKRKNSEYAKDAKYWEGGACNWGGSHNLKEDCQTIAKSFNKIDDLKNTKKELESCTSEQEFESTKSRFIRQAEELELGLVSKTGASSSMFGICIIWAEYNSFLDSKLKPLRNEIRRLKEELGKNQYKYFQELKILQLEQKQIENSMKKNNQKAMTETDPDKKALLLQLIEEDGENLKENLKKQKAIPTTNLKFDPGKHVNDLIKALKEAISRSTKKPSKSNSDESNDDSDDDNPTGTPNNPFNPFQPSHNSTDKNWWQENQQLLIFAGIVLALTFYLYSQKETTEENHYDY